MLRFFAKIIKTPKTVIPLEKLCEDAKFEVIGEKLNEKIKKLLGGSLAVREVDAGSTNACEQELIALSNCFYDVDRFGVKFTASPRHADMLLITGPVSRNMAEALKRAYEAMPEPKLVVAIGDDAIDGGIFKGSYAVCDGVDKVIPVDFKISGDPPSPKTVLCGLLKILEAIDNKKS